MIPDRKEVAQKRVFLFLQGPSSSLFADIAANLRAAGAECVRINLNAGDWIFWHRGALSYCGKLADWPAYMAGCIDRYGITDLVVHGEERPYHRAAIDVARRHGVSIYAVEMGHLRPDWITIEREGLSSNSRFPTDPEHIMRAAAALPEPDWQRRYSHTFLAEAVADLMYYLPTVFFWFFYPHYRRHGLFHPLAEYAGWIWRLATGRRRTREAGNVVDSLVAEDTEFFVYPLQIQTDFQLRAHSPFRGQEDAILMILRSFAAHASTTAQLIIKLHPLDNGLIGWPRIVSGIAMKLGIGGRVIVIDGGDLNRLTLASRGMVTVNSTAALAALQSGKPVKVLGETIYDISGLTDQQPLDGFWSAPALPSAELCAAFLRLLAASIQVRGSFYSRDGIQAAAAAIAERLLARSVNVPDAYIDPPPRKRPTKIDVV